MKNALVIIGLATASLPLNSSAQTPLKYIPPLANGLSIGLAYGAYINFSDVTHPPTSASVRQFKAADLKFAPDLLLAYTWRHRWRLETGYAAGYTAGVVLDAVVDIGLETVYSLPIERLPLRLERHFHPGNGRWSLYPQIGLTYAYIQKYNQNSYLYTYQPIAYAKPELGYYSIELEDLGRYRMACFEVGGGANCQFYP